MFKRFLIFSVLERVSDDLVAEDKQRLNAFLKLKEKKVIGTKTKKECCGRKP